MAWIGWFESTGAHERNNTMGDNAAFKRGRQSGKSTSAKILAEYHISIAAKPWLAAKTAGEAYALAREEEFAGIEEIDEARAAYEFCARCVIEWHEAQRERVGEYWKVRTLMHDYDYTDEQIARDTAYGSEPRAKLIRVTRYRRKR